MNINMLVALMKVLEVIVQIVKKNNAISNREPMQ